MADTSIIDLTEDSFTEEYVSTGDNLRFEPPSRQSEGSTADQSLIFVGETRAPLRSLQQSYPVQMGFNRPSTVRKQNKKPTTKAKVVEKPVARVETPPPAPSPAVDQPTCPICFETFSEIKASKRNLMTTRCGHIFCSTCLERVKKTGRSTTSRLPIVVVECPTCRKAMHWEACHPIYL